MKKSSIGIFAVGALLAVTFAFDAAADETARAKADGTSQDGAQTENGAATPADANAVKNQNRYRHRVHAAAANVAQSKNGGKNARAQKFVDRDGDGVCDGTGKKDGSKKQLQKGKANRHRNREAGAARGFGRGKGAQGGKEGGSGKGR